MNFLVIGFAGLACLLHIAFGVVEVGYPQLILGIKTTELPESTRLVFYNQGFYNFFLALGGLYGIHTSIQPKKMSAILTFVLLSMVGASIVLFQSKPELISGALVQGLPPFFALIASVIFTKKDPKEINHGIL